MMENLIAIIIGAIFVNNIVLTRILGICPYIGVSKQTKPAFEMGLAVTFVMTCASFITWFLQRFILEPLGIEYLKIIAFILVIAAFVQLTEIFIKKFSDKLYRTLGIYLPLITTNCAILGIAFINVSEGYSLLAAVVSGFATGIGFILALLLMSGIRERLELSDVPRSLRGAPIAFITAGLMSMAFLAFAGMI